MLDIIIGESPDRTAALNSDGLEEFDVSTLSLPIVGEADNEPEAAVPEDLSLPIVGEEEADDDAFWTVELPVVGEIEGEESLSSPSGSGEGSSMIVVVVWQIGSRINDPHMHSSIFFSPQFSAKHQPNADSNSFWFRGGVLIEGCLVPLIAIYPTAIIVLVALNKSAVENGLRRDAHGGVGTCTAIAVAVETVVDTHTDSDAEDDTACASGEGDSRSDLGHSEKR
ncbi:hypothetical protein GSI_11338 [Ganoderma sinense ZZ0214-1]|uniref:Uncharacterized protein n=1 Tax=Ganoderma sinense ZZ0214-1 TaxID=1077348 RepID=A0A2G8RVQ1_9APHY|nr:hypothetical protein GSI_11338 [Ganoderma sinense ZZ0214-1]